LGPLDKPKLNPGRVLALTLCVFQFYTETQGMTEIHDADKNRQNRHRTNKPFTKTKELSL
jgi:hypothetical protein